VLPEAPKDVSIGHINSTTVRVGWSMAASGDTVIAYHVELLTSDGNVVSRKSSSKERSLLLTHLQPNIEYRVRVQAENAAGNGSSSTYVSININKKEGKSFARTVVLLMGAKSIIGCLKSRQGSG